MVFDEDLFQNIAKGVIGWSLLIFISLQFTKAGYGRYSDGTAFSLDDRVGWFIQEFPALLVPVALFFYQDCQQSFSMTTLILILMYSLHYCNRIFVYPFHLKGKPMPVYLVVLAFVFCALNGFLQGGYLLCCAQYSKDWTCHPQFIFGVCVFVFGMFVNIQSDSILRNLRQPGETGYKIPIGGLFNYVSGANFFGEILEWWGYALACNSLPALAFAISTTCNLGPRAFHHHRWYKDKFDDYPPGRKALIPFIV